MTSRLGTGKWFKLFYSVPVTVKSGKRGDELLVDKSQKAYSIKLLSPDNTIHWTEVDSGLMSLERVAKERLLLSRRKHIKLLSRDNAIPGTGVDW